jgi:DNA primase
MKPTDMLPIKQIPILDVAGRLGIQFRGKKAMCFGGHDKRTPSLSLMPSRNSWKCYGCGKSGDALQLVMEVLGCDFRESLDWFAREYTVDVRQGGSRRQDAARRLGNKGQRIAPKILQVSQRDECEFTADSDVYGWLIDKCGEMAQVHGLEFMRNHGIPLDLANRFGVRELRDPKRAFRRMIERWGAKRVFRSGLAWGEEGKPECLIWTSYAVLFPFYVRSQVKYIQGRLFRGDPKYLNPRGVAKPLYNIQRLDTLSSGAIVHICEGVPDALALEGQGLAAVAVLGASSFRAEWVDLFMKFDVVLMPDGDSGGETFLRTISGLFMARGKAVRTVRLPDGKDVADVVAKMARDE